MPSFNVTSPDEAFRDISSILVELKHNLFMVTEEKDNEVIRCIECRNERPREEFTKIFHRGEGICKRCWNHDIDSE